MLHIGAVALDLFLAEALPLVQDGIVVLQVEVRVREAEVRVVLEHLHDGDGKDRGNAPVQVFGVHAYEAEVDGVGFLQGFQEPEGGAGCQLAAPPGQGAGQRREGNAEAHHLLVLIQDDGHILGIDVSFRIPSVKGTVPYRHS